MDLKKYVGEALAEGLVAQTDPNADTAALIVSLLDDPNSLGGEAKQKLRELTGSIALAEANLQNAIYTLEWTEKLHQKQYVAETELQRDRLERQRLELETEKAEIAKDLFMRYEFPKQAEQYLSDYKEAQRELERTQARARSQLAQAKAKLTSAKATLDLQTQRLAKLRKQIDACVIKAPAVGQVVYWSSTERWTRVKIEQGAEVPEGYKIITIPDTSEMKVEIKVHETWIDKVQIGQEGKISIAAFPDKVFAGKVLKKAPLADPEEWLNPDLKVYATDVSIEGRHEALKTGMTGKVEVIIDELHDVLYVPIQSVVTVGNDKVCYVAGSPAQRREVETGLFNDNFVEVKSGLQEGERVLLNPPRWTAAEKDQEQAGEPNAPAAQAN
jgi:RND family efflux transporter MFP subunit